MEPELKAFLASACLHLLVAGSAVSFAAFSRQPELPLLVECTVELGQLSETPERGRKPALPALPVPPSPRQARTRIATLPRETLPVAPVVQAGAMTAPAHAIPAPVSPSVVTPAPVLVAPDGNGRLSATSLPQGRAGVGPATGPDAGSSVPASSGRGESVESPQARYLNEHFAAIRSLIAGNLRYPGKARRMGWSGKLAVEFVIRESGEVEQIRVVKSSGIALLDCDARETVRRSAPFPPPPVSARLVVPVEYRLE